MLTDFLIEGINHIEIFVTDRVKSTKWYGEIFGLKVIKEFEIWAKIGPLFIGTEDRSVILAIMNGKKSMMAPLTEWHLEQVVKNLWIF